MDKDKMDALIHIETKEGDVGRVEASVTVKGTGTEVAYALGLLLYNIEEKEGSLDDVLFMALQVTEHIKRDKTMVTVDRGMIRKLLGEGGSGHD